MESLLLCGIDPPWDLSFGWSQIEAVIELLFLFSSGPTSNHTRIQMRGDQVCDAEFTNVEELWGCPNWGQIGDPVSQSNSEEEVVVRVSLKRQILVSLPRDNLSYNHLEVLYNARWA